MHKLYYSLLLETAFFYIKPLQNSYSLNSFFVGITKVTRWPWGLRRRDRKALPNGQGPLYGVVSDEEIEHEQQVDGREDPPGVHVDLLHLDR